MMRSMIFLVGASVLGAIMAAAYYAPDNLEFHESSSAYNLGPGEVKQDTVHPSLAGSDIVYEIEVRGGSIDVYVMERPWAASLSTRGNIDLSQPFSFDAGLSKTHVNGTFSFVIHSDGETTYNVIFDNSDNFYAGDAGEDGNQTTARVSTVVRFVELESQSLTFGYLATIPSILLVVVTFGRQYKRWRRGRKARHEAEQA